MQFISTYKKFSFLFYRPFIISFHQFPFFPLLFFDVVFLWLFFQFQSSILCHSFNFVSFLYFVYILSIFHPLYAPRNHYFIDIVTNKRHIVNINTYRSKTTKDSHTTDRNTCKSLFSPVMLLRQLYYLTKQRITNHLHPRECIRPETRNKEEHCKQKL